MEMWHNYYDYSDTVTPDQFTSIEILIYKVYLIFGFTNGTQHLVNGISSVTKIKGARKAYK